MDIFKNKIQISQFDSRQKFFFGYSAVSIKRTEPLSYFEVFAPPCTCFYVLNNFLFHPVLVFHVINEKNMPPLFAYYLLFA